MICKEACGVKIAEEIIGMRPDMGAIIITAWGGSNLEKELENSKLKGCRIVSKGAAPKEQLSVIREVLDIRKSEIGSSEENSKIILKGNEGDEEDRDVETLGGSKTYIIVKSKVTSSRKVLVKKLKEQGHLVSEVDTLKEAVDVAKECEGKFHLICEESKQYSKDQTEIFRQKIPNLESIKSAQQILGEEESSVPEGEENQEEEGSIDSDDINRAREDSREAITDVLSHCQVELCENTPIFLDVERGRYKEVVEAYNRFMAIYVGKSEEWGEHYKRQAKALENALGIYKSTPANKVDKILDKECIVIFGCGYNDKGVSKKVKESLAKGHGKLVLVDFSRMALGSAIEKYGVEGVEVTAAYQMSISRARESTLNGYIEGTSKENMEAYIRFFGKEVDKLAKELVGKGTTPGTYKISEMLEEHRPTIAVSAMVGAATFLTVYDKIKEVVEKEAKNSEQRESLITELNRIHAQFNAFVMQLHITQMLGLCKWRRGKDGKKIKKLLFITDTNKRKIILKEQEGGRKVGKKELEGDVKKIKEGKEDELEIIKFDSPEVRISRDGEKIEDIEDIIRQIPGLDDALTEDRGKWVWLDALYEQNDRHGHDTMAIEIVKEQRFVERVKAVLPQIVCCALGLKGGKADFSATRIPEQSYFDEAVCWLAMLELSSDDISAGDINPSQDAKNAAEQILLLVGGKKEYLEKGWKSCLHYLVDKKNWSLGDSEDFVKAGYFFLIELAEDAREWVAEAGK